MNHLSIGFGGRAPIGRAPAPVCFDITVNDETLSLHESGAVWWPDQDTLIVADLHMEKASSFARGGQFLPPYDTRATLDRLEMAIDCFEPRRVVALGDSFHDSDGSARLPVADRAMLALLQLRREWIWITGNHDPIAPISLCGEVMDELTLGRLTLRHAPIQDAIVGEIAGHLHPAARVRRFGRGVRRPCFAVDHRRIVLPAFGVLSGGVNVLNAAWRHIFDAHRFRAFMLGDGRLYPVPADRLAPD